MRRAGWTIVILAAARVASAQAMEERVEVGWVDESVRVAALPSGGALVLAGNSPGGPWPYYVEHVGDVGTADPYYLPAIGEARDLAIRGDVMWILGTTAAAVRSGGTAWRQVPLAAREGAHGEDRVVAIDEHRALAIRNIGRAAFVDELDEATDSARSLATFEGVQLVHAIADDRGGAWASVVAADTPIGYAHYSGGRWTCWQLAPDHAASLAHAGCVLRAAPAELAASGDLAPDGKGGWLAASDRDLVHVRSDGSGLRLRDRLPARHVAAVGYDASRDRVLVLVSDDTWTANGHDLHLVMLDGEGAVLGIEDLALPRWYRERHAPPLAAGQIAADAHALWITAGPFVLERRGSHWIEHYAVDARDPTHVASSGDEDRVDHWSAAGVVAGSALVGELGGGAIHRDGRAGYELAGGTLGALAPALLLEATLPSQRPEHPGPGLPQIAWAMNDLAYGVGLVGAASLSGATTYGVGSLVDPQRSSNGARDGAFAGAAVGTAISAFVANALYKKWPDRPVLRVSVTASVIGTAATLGYQLGGGGRK